MVLLIKSCVKVGRVTRVPLSSELLRCGWAEGPSDYQAYHDEEWGKPLKSERDLFERLCLEGFQSGLSWLTVLRKREAFRSRFQNFEIMKLALWGEQEIQVALLDAGIIRHRGKIEAVVNNAQVLVELHKLQGPNWLLDTFQQAAPSDESLTRQGFARPPVELNQVPSQSVESQQLSKLLRKAGFKFVGPTTVYSTLQASGLVDDHIASCFARSR